MDSFRALSQHVGFAADLLAPLCDASVISIPGFAPLCTKEAIFEDAKVIYDRRGGKAGDCIAAAQYGGIFLAHCHHLDCLDCMKCMVGRSICEGQQRNKELKEPRSQKYANWAEGGNKRF